MEEEKGCPLFRKRESLSFGKGVGYCDMDGNSTNCDADTKFCEKPDGLKQYLQRRLDKFEKKGVSRGYSPGKLLEVQSIKTHTKSPLSFKEDKRVGLNSHEERRQHPRYSVKVPLDFWQTPDVVQGGLVTDMSEAGLGFQSIHEIQIGAELKIRVYLSKMEYSFDSIEGTGKIIWRIAHREQEWKGYKYGMYIMQMPSESRDRLMKYIFMLQEEESSSH